MLLSIIVPVYNVRSYLVKCLDSIHNQTFQDYEVIVVDDGSTDGSGQLADDYCRGKDKFCVYHKENGGLMSAWKYGVEQAKGDYIGFVDSDDYIEPIMYEELVKWVNACSPEIVLCNHYYETQDGKLTLHRNPIRDGLYLGDKLTSIRKLMLPRLGTDYISPSRWSKVIKKELLLQCLKYTDNRISSAEDVNSMVPCLLKCKSFAYVDKPLYHYVMRKTSISFTFRQEWLDTYSILLDKLNECIEDLHYNDVLGTDGNTLYNFYGVLWSIYVLSANLSLKEKRGQLLRVINDSSYLYASIAIKAQDGTIAMIYKYMIMTKSPIVFIIGKRIHEAALRVLRRGKNA